MVVVVAVVVVVVAAVVASAVVVVAFSFFCRGKPENWSREFENRPFGERHERHCRRMARLGYLAQSPDEVLISVRPVHPRVEPRVNDTPLT